MARYKGRQSAKAIEQAFPHIIEIEVPTGGLGTQMIEPKLAGFIRRSS